MGEGRAPRTDNVAAGAEELAVADQHDRADGRIKRGDLIVLEAMGGGFTWGAAVVRF